MVRVLVTGATGFVGANLTRALAESSDFDVHVAVRPQSDLSRLAGVVDDLAVYSTDTSDFAEVDRLVSDVRPDVIYHLATYGGLPNQADVDLTIASNIKLTVNLVEAALKYDVKKFVNTGSSSEYGMKDAPMRETDICEPMNLYGITKLAATNYCSMIGKRTGFHVCTLRLFSPYGPHEQPTRLYPTIRTAILDGVAPMLSKPDSVRDFIPVDKVVQVYLKMIETDFDPGIILNVGSGRQQTIREFYYGIAAELGLNPLEPIWGTSAQRSIEPKTWVASTDRLVSVMGDGFI